MNKEYFIIILLVILFILTLLWINQNNNYENFYGVPSSTSIPQRRSRPSLKSQSMPSTSQPIPSSSSTSQPSSSQAKAQGQIDIDTSFSDISDVNSLFKMFNSLEQIEEKCEEIEEKEELFNDKYIMKTNDKLIKELEEQDIKINELKEIVKYLTLEKKRKDKINNKCRENKQIKINENYSLASKINKDKLIKNNLNLDLNVSDSLKANIKSLGKNLKIDEEKNETRKQPNCKSKGKSYTNLDKVNLSDKCYGCDSKKIKKNYAHVINDYKK